MGPQLFIFESSTFQAFLKTVISEIYLRNNLQNDNSLPINYDIEKKNI